MSVPLENYMLYDNNIKRVLAVGHTGAGKSSALNTLSGSNLFKVYHGLESGTKNA